MMMMMMMGRCQFNICLWVFGLLFTLAQTQENEECLTPDSRPGLCISIYSCQEIIQLIQTQQSRNPRVLNFLRSSECGYIGNRPLVCCGLKSQPIQTKPPPNIVVTTPTPTPTIPTPSTGRTIINTDGPPVNGPTYKLPTGLDCGINNVSYTKVVGGRPALLGEFPWIVALGYRNGKNARVPKWLCGGSLITDKHVLTAAHCVHNRDDLYMVRAGDLDLYDDDDGAQPVDVTIEKVIKHEGFNPTSVTDDIAIIVLTHSVKGFLINPVCLPTSEKLRSQSFERYSPFVSGWGSVYFRGPSSPKLQTVMLPVVSNNQCKRSFSIIKNAVIDDRVLCAGYLAGKKDSCEGDSGGPLIIAQGRDRDFNQFYQIGIVSYGFRCAEEGFPGVYTRVTAFLDWIEKNLI